MPEKAGSCFFGKAHRFQAPPCGRPPEHFNLFNIFNVKMLQPVLRRIYGRKNTGLTHYLLRIFI
jgi:hypothetical protein